MTRAIKFVPTGVIMPPPTEPDGVIIIEGFYTIRGWDGSEGNHTESDLLSASMSEDSRLAIKGLIDASAKIPGEWVEYPNG
jgi:hypothetical protein